MALIKENWKAIEEVEQKAKEQSGDPDAAFNPTLFFLGEKQLILDVKYRKQIGPKNNKRFSKTYSTISVPANYCPFTGKPLYKDEQ